MQNERWSGTNRSVRVRARQFAVCLVIFLAVLIGKTMFRTQTEDLYTSTWKQLTYSPDLRGLLVRLGQSAKGGGSMLDDLGDFCITVFGPDDQHGIIPADQVVQTMQPDRTEESSVLSAGPAQPSQHYKGSLPFPSDQYVPTIPSGTNTPDVWAGGILKTADYEGEELPAHCTMDHISLGDLEITEPVMGRISSPYGYRSHPTSGVHRFHKGLDIAADTGTPILSFADGIVEFIGENDSFGQYIQLDHGHGIKSLYAHCSKLCADKGDPVSRGEQIALVGSTGDSTGPHLHLELKYNETNLNPAYYIKSAEQN